eukprot:gene24213-9812_t
MPLIYELEDVKGFSLQGELALPGEQEPSHIFVIEGYRSNSRQADMLCLNLTNWSMPGWTAIFPLEDVEEWCKDKGPTPNPPSQIFSWLRQALLDEDAQLHVNGRPTPGRVQYLSWPGRPSLDEDAQLHVNAPPRGYLPEATFQRLPPRGAGLSSVRGDEYFKLAATMGRRLLTQATDKNEECQRLSEEATNLKRNVEERAEFVEIIRGHDESFVWSPRKQKPARINSTANPTSIPASPVGCPPANPGSQHPGAQVMVEGVSRNLSQSLVPTLGGGESTSRYYDTRSDARASAPTQKVQKICESSSPHLDSGAAGGSGQEAPPSHNILPQVRFQQARGARGRARGSRPKLAGT